MGSWHREAIFYTETFVIYGFWGKMKISAFYHISVVYNDCLGVKMMFLSYVYHFEVVITGI